MSRQLIIATGVLVSLGFGAPAGAAGNTYKFVDKEGNVTYSQTRPPDQQRVETLKLRESHVTNANARQNLDSLTGRANEAVKDKDTTESHATAMRERDERMKQNCEVARENMRILESTSRIQAKDAQGNTYFLDEQQIEQKIKETKRQIETNCG